MQNISIIILMGVLLMVTPMLESVAAESKGEAPVAKSAKKTKSRTLKELIAYAEKNGKDVTLGQTQADDLGFSSRLPAKRFVYVLSKKPRTHTRSLWVIYDESSLPEALIWSDFKKDAAGEKFSEDSWQYKSTLAGDLQRCAHLVGDADTASQTVVEVDAAVQKSFRDLVSFFLVDAVKPAAEVKK